MSGPREQLSTPIQIKHEPNCYSAQRKAFMESRDPNALLVLDSILAVICLICLLSAVSTFYQASLIGRSGPSRSPLSRHTSRKSTRIE